MCPLRRRGPTATGCLRAEWWHVHPARVLTRSSPARLPLLPHRSGWRIAPASCSFFSLPSHRILRARCTGGLKASGYRLGDLKVSGDRGPITTYQLEIVTFMAHRIAVSPGDGIGTEVVPEGIRVLEAAGRRFGFDFEWTTFDWSCERYAKTGSMMPDDGLEQLRRFEAIFLGAVGFPG